MARPHIAAVLEDAWHGQLNGVLQARGWIPRVIAHTGYGSSTFVRVLARVVLSRHTLDSDETRADDTTRTVLAPPRERRGWRAFITAQATGVDVEVTIDGVTHRTHTDRSGYVDLTVVDHGLAPGWHEVTVTPSGGRPQDVAVVIIGDEVRHGIVSDIDDTVMITVLPRMFIAAWNTFVRHEQARHIVPGMAPLYRDLLSSHPGAPIFYLSTGAWNTAPTLTRFLSRHGYPLGPLLLTDWGPTNTGWFRSGQEHKRENLHRLAREFPDIQWILVGDDGQHDPKIYGSFAQDRPDVVRAIAIRELTPAEQVLSHGLPVSNEEFGPRVVHGEVPVVRAGDGYGLQLKLDRILSRHGGE
nr:phosphatase domain-containing protein [Austwickia sp. TVS 96-490-7B]